ncbi:MULTISPECIES: peptide-N-glycosidase F-related protein [Mesonia]|uniref:Peptide-N(4)-(N-acetyl-beta-D-glucosaminyl)asparagine amidase F n=1 Tax=Mesonia oceanica TaxID=2687242 RepID=A0AC61Y3R0_9FLAO|nr:MULTISPECIES: peptide-N-glycosidase F-related protein [Mesonia]MAN26334.1 hypothetical protein [Mesonia sp.]MBJ97469.1 hypothetical protein [Flavobacteriaceae bacterium]VVU98943.1 Peptide-N(4)-(N-acetyl-beta-D-glucosaminyl)asparagine amidase F [Mesonia oceanica]|tara:strand:- start:21454 stop:23418 length:1965 start_codon:yes stop_codon:yes gene_type:complete
MRKITFLFFTLLICTLSNAQNTSYVTTDQVNLNYYGDFDSSVTFPDGTDSYREILLTCKLGQYDCPSEEQYCHEWDYTVKIELLTEDGSIELGRFITPFATSGWPRFGSDWEQPYVFDVTDFYPLLQGDQDIRIHYSGYSGGFTAELEFAFVEGIPPHNVVGIEQAYQVEHTYGDSNDPYNDYLSTFTGNAPQGTERARMKVIITGHGNDDNGCCEFANHYYNVLLNNSTIAEQEIWRSDCGENDLYPQGGTWIYNRSNWCPGLEVSPIYHDLSNISAGDSFNLDVEFENYNGSGSLGSYDYNGIVFYYGETNSSIDAEVSAIIAPSNDPHYFRDNPSGSIPKIEVRNTGEEPITAINFSYGVQDSIQQNFAWTGNILPLEKEVIEFPNLTTLTNISIEQLEGLQQFNVEILTVNGQTDGNSENNLKSSEFETAPNWPSNLVARLQTSNLGANGYLDQSPTDVSWEITDMDGNVIASRTNADVSTLYNDEVEITEPGFYKLKLNALFCYGLNWWVLGNYPEYQAGYFRMTDQNDTNLPLNNYTYSGTPHDDWGCSYTQYFSVGEETLEIEKQELMTFNIYPNPAKNFINVNFPENLGEAYKIELVDIHGRKVYESSTQTQNNEIPVAQLANGLYVLVLKNESGAKRIEKVMISH